MKEKNNYTYVLFAFGLAAIIHLVYSLSSYDDWKIVLLVAVITIAFEITPITLPNGLHYSISSIASVFALYSYGFSISTITVFLSAFVFFFVKPPVKFQFRWFRFFVTLGMYFMSLTVAYLAFLTIKLPFQILDILLLAMIYDGVNLTLKNGIMISIHGHLDRKSILSDYQNLGLPILVCTLVAYKLLFAQTFEEVFWETGYIFFFVFTIFILTTAYHKQLLKVEESRQSFQSLYDNNPDIVLSVNKEGRTIAANPLLESGLGYTLEDLKSRSIFSLLTDDHAEKTNVFFNEVLQGTPKTSNVEVRHADGDTREFFITCVPTVVNQKVVGAYIIGKDITLEREAERTIERMAYYDSITGLANRVLLMERLHREIRRVEETDEKLGVFYVDMDKFKKINDTLGHSMGDLMLIQTAERILRQVPPTAFVSRLGGDEFAIILPVKEEEECFRLAQKWIDAFRSPVLLGEHSLFVTPSIGISMYPEHGLTADALLAHADTAMYKVKSEGGANFLLFTKDMQKEKDDQMKMELFLRSAVVSEEFWLQYQPKLDLATGEIHSAEALIRWYNPLLGYVSPADFIPLSERSRLIIPIGKWVLQTACAQNKAWQDLGFPPIRISVNISSTQLQCADFTDMIREVLKETGLDPKWLELEITEGVLVENIESNIRVLEELREIGISLAIDDFGVGYSSLGYLHRFAIDTLKIDQSFVRNIGENTNDELIVKTIIGLAHNLNLNVVAEGVETEEQYGFIRSQACDGIQGYIVSKPLQPEDFMKKVWIEQDYYHG